jgi:hypothetical protein
MRRKGVSWLSESQSTVKRSRFGDSEERPPSEERDTSLIHPPPFSSHYGTRPGYGYRIKTKGSEDVGSMSLQIATELRSSKEQIKIKSEIQEIWRYIDQQDKRIEFLIEENAQLQGKLRKQARQHESAFEDLKSQNTAL